MATGPVVEAEPVVEGTLPVVVEPQGTRRTYEREYKKRVTTLMVI